MFHHDKEIFPFFAVKLGHIIINDFFSLGTKHTTLTAKIGKKKKKL